jgi:hypothetical protein
MSRVLASVLAAFALTAAGCGSTNTGPGGGGGGRGATQGQETNEQPEAGGLKTPVYTAAHNVCSLFPVAELARQNGTKPTAEAVAQKVAASESTPKARKEAYQGCLDGIHNK